MRPASTQRRMTTRAEAHQRMDGEIRRPGHRRPDRQPPREHGPSRWLVNVGELPLGLVEEADDVQGLLGIVDNLGVDDDL